MARRKLLSYLYPTYLAITILSVVAVGLYASSSMGRFYTEQVRKNLEVRSRMATEQMRPPLRAGDDAKVNEVAGVLGNATGTRLTVMLPNGDVVGDSDEDPALMESHADREEMREALRGNVGTSTRPSTTLGKNMTYVAVPVFGEDGALLAVVRASLPATDIEEALDSVYFNLALGALVTAAVAALVCLYAARRISRPLDEMRSGAEQFARGEFAHRIHPPAFRELAQLADTLNSMAQQLDDRIRTITRQRSESDAILSSMAEGVIALDSQEHVLTVNRAAADFFEVDPDWARGRPIQEVVRNREMQELVTSVLHERRERDSEFSVESGETRHLHAYATPLQDTADREIGALVVLNDITHLRRLEKVRSDFVANVSHELKTPITAVKGFAEALLDGAVEDKEQARRFLDIIARQSERLHAIIEDLLLLSRVEQDHDLHKEPISMVRMLDEALDVCRPAAENRGVVLHVQCEPDLKVSCNSALVEQAVVNLVDNAIKYSESGGDVQVLAGTEDGTVFIKVQDHGCGISEEHLSRLFERFYRVDKARSRKMGGTGLGLSIVRHIANVHGGTVHAESKPGKGSIFTIELPAA